jgi:nucleotide-binding universal stress UspA family protein
MLRVRTILFPTDFSLASDAALSTACHWARKLDSELHLLHALETIRPDLYAGSLGGADAATLAAQLEREAHRELEVRRRMAANQGANVVVAAVSGLDAAPVILDYAESRDIDLIAMSTHGRRGVRRLLLGSVAEEVVQRSKCPVLTMAGDKHRSNPLSPERILAAVDLSDHSRAPVAHAKHLAALFGAELHLLHVIVRQPVAPYYNGLGRSNLVFEPPLLEQEAIKALEALRDEVPPGNGRVSVAVTHGLPGEQILSFATVHHNDLIVIASHGLTGFSHLLLGSVAEKVVRLAASPVLTLKSLGKSLVTGDAAALSVEAARA